MKNLLFVCSLILLFQACKQQPVMPEIKNENNSNFPDFDPFADARIIELRNFNQFPRKYISMDSLRNSVKKVAKTDPKREENQIKVTNAKIISQYWWETSTHWVTLQPGGRIGSTYLGPIPSSVMQKSIVNGSQMNWDLCTLIPVTGFGVTITDKKVSHLGLGNATVIGTGGVLTSNWYQTEPAGNSVADLDAFIWLPESESPRRVVVGIGVGVHDNTVQTIWLYAAPYNAANKRIDIAAPADIWLYILYPGIRGGEKWDTMPQRVARTWDVAGQWNVMTRMFITGASLATKPRTNPVELNRLGLQVTVIE
jgi:hypothetical protein